MEVGSLHPKGRLWLREMSMPHAACMKCTMHSRLVLMLQNGEWRKTSVLNSRDFSMNM